MSSEFHLKVGDIEVWYGTDHLPPDVLLPFQAGDLRQKVMDNQPILHEYRAQAGTVARRLELLGHSLAKARRAYARGVREIEEWERQRWPEHLICRDGFEQWCRTILATARKVQEGRTGNPIDDHPPHWEETLLGFPGGRLGEVLRALVEVVPAETPVTLDLTDLLQGGYISEDADLCHIDGRMPLIILTEGTSDSRLLREALTTLHAELSDFVRFIDYETANPQGGTDSLIQFVKMFVGCGIPNRIVVLFDNDAAGHQALVALMRLALPENVRATCLPSLPWFASYPTDGPDGRTSSNIDGRACALELYLGREALTDEAGHLRPVRWGGFNDKLGRYQGQVAGKVEIQKRFAEMLAEVKAGRMQARAVRLRGGRGDLRAGVRGTRAGSCRANLTSAGLSLRLARPAGLHVVHRLLRAQLLRRVASA